jgi:hypothetical protein
MTKMNYLFLNRPDEALATYRELLGYTKVSTGPPGGSQHGFPKCLLLCSRSQSHVTRNYAEKSINNILDYVGGEGKVSLISRGSRRGRDVKLASIAGVAKTSSTQTYPQKSRWILWRSSTKPPASHARKRRTR